MIRKGKKWISILMMLPIAAFFSMELCAHSVICHQLDGTKTLEIDLFNSHNHCHSEVHLDSHKKEFSGDKETIHSFHCFDIEISGSLYLRVSRIPVWILQPAGSQIGSRIFPLIENKCFLKSIYLYSIRGIPLTLTNLYANQLLC